MSYNNLSSVATLEILAQLVTEAALENVVPRSASPSPWTLEAPIEGEERLFLVALSAPGRKGSEARCQVSQVWFTWRESEVADLGRQAREENRSFQVVTLVSAETPWANLDGLSPVGGLKALESEDDRGFGYYDRYSWLRGNPRQKWSYCSREACLREASGWRTAADKALGDCPWGSCNNI